MANVPPYMRITQYAQELARERADGDVRIMSERELAERFSVARMTVRKALKSLTKSGVLIAKPGLGTFVNHERANFQRGFKSWRIGFGVADGRHFDYDGIYLWAFSKLSESLATRPGRLKLLNVSGRDVDMEEEFRLFNPDALIWFRPFPEAVPVIDSMGADRPTAIAGSLPSGDPRSIAMDYFEAGRIAARWFLSKGFRKPLFLGFSSATTKAVYDGWLEAFDEAGAKFDASQGVTSLPQMDSALDEALRAGADSVFCFSHLLFKLRDALKRLGLASPPLMTDEDFSFAPPDFPRSSAKLVMVSPKLMRLAVERVFAQLEGGAAPSSELVLMPEVKELS